MGDGEIRSARRTAGMRGSFQITVTREGKLSGKAKGDDRQLRLGPKEDIREQKRGGSVTPDFWRAKW